jgi:transposase
VPLSFAPGEAYQFDWSHEIVVLNGVTTTVKGAHVRLCHSRMPFVRAYPRENQEMVFDAHVRAFEFFKGACTRGIYDYMKTAVEAVFIGKERRFNRRFLQCRRKRALRARSEGEAGRAESSVEGRHNRPSFLGRRPTTETNEVRCESATSGAAIRR